MRKSSNYMMAVAHEIVFKNGVRYDKKSNTYQVKSKSQKSKVYIIENKKELECKCKGFEMRENCSHLAAVRIFREGLNK